MKYEMVALIALTMSMAASAENASEKAAASQLGHGYLGAGPMANSTVLSPPPPVAGSGAEARDIESSKAALALKDSARWKLAASDADVFTPAAPGTMSCAAGVEISPKNTPTLNKLLRRTIADLGLSTSAIKKQYNRPRPFTVNGEPTCTPDWEPMLRKNGSYPSGHSAIGYGWGLILAELFPERSAQLVARGRAFGDSRRICNVHWLSDVEEGRIAAAATVARLHDVRQFREDMEAAKVELSKVKSEAPKRDCADEAAALALVK